MADALARGWEIGPPGMARMTDSTNEADLDVLIERAGLALSSEERRWVHRAWESYRPQLRALLALDLEGEEVGTAFLPGPGDGGGT